MCTSIAMQQGGGLFGRNLDLEYPFGQQVAITPRRFPLTFRRQPPMERHLAMAGMAHVAKGCPLYAEAVNEAGLYMAGLYFPGNAWYPAEVPADLDAVAPYELIPWVLGRCETLDQAREQLARFRPLGVPFADDLPLAPLHWHLADRTGAAVLEATREGVRLYDDPVGVLTNNPPFPFHQTNLRQYQALSPRPPENHLAPHLPLEPGAPSPAGALRAGLGRLWTARRRLAGLAVSAGGVFETAQPRRGERNGPGDPIFPSSGWGGHGAGQRRDPGGPV